MTGNIGGELRFPTIGLTFHKEVTDCEIKHKHRKIRTSLKYHREKNMILFCENVQPTDSQVFTLVSILFSHFPSLLCQRWPCLEYGVVLHVPIL